MGWRTVAAPAAFAAAALALLVYGRTQGEVRPLALWLGVALIGAVAAWPIRGRRGRSRATAESLGDPVTGLGSRAALRRDVEEPPSGAGGRRGLLLFDVDDFQAFSDRFGQSAGDEMLRRA